MIRGGRETESRNEITRIETVVSVGCHPFASVDGKQNAGDWGVPWVTYKLLASLKLNNTFKILDSGMTCIIGKSLIANLQNK